MLTVSFQSGAEVTGAALASHMDVQKISLTGSIATGKKVQEAATRSNLKRVTLELGGKSPSIIFDDANIESALFWSNLGITVNAGQVCAASSRLYVQESIAEQVIDRLKQDFEKIGESLGSNPQDKSTTYGPLVDKVQYDQVARFIEEGKSEATLIAGGNIYRGEGHFVSPVIFLNPKDDAKVYKQEVFGPVLCIKTFKTEEEVLKMANNTTYGLAGIRCQQQEHEMPG